MESNTIALGVALIALGGFLLNTVVSIIKGTKALDKIVKDAIKDYNKTVEEKINNVERLYDQKLLSASNEVEQCIDKQILIEKELNGPGSITQIIGILETRCTASEKRLEKMEDKM